MELTQAKQQEYMRRIMIARMSILSRNGFFGLLLMHMRFALDESVETAATDGERIYFAPAFLDEISDPELVFVLMHEIMHVALRHTFRTGGRDPLLFNIACDIVVNSNIMDAAGGDIRSITLAKYGPSMNTAPDGKAGSKYTAEEVYDMIVSSASGTQGQRAGKGALKPGRCPNSAGMDPHSGFSDDHSKWGTAQDKHIDELWKQRMREAYEAASSRIIGNGKGIGDLPAGVDRMLRELMEPKTDWRILLNDFVQEEVVDYSFSPPDRRFSDSPFFLPDYNETDITVKNILFWIDTSGSMTDQEITEAYSEIKGAIDQFGGRLEGWLGFFDAAVVPPAAFADENEFRVIKPKGGGGTSFKVIFDYVQEEMADMEIASIIILTDGYASFPDKSAAMGIPVLWMVNNDDVDPPWGKVARI